METPNPSCFSPPYSHSKSLTTSKVVTVLLMSCDMTKRGVPFGLSFLLMKKSPSGERSVARYRYRWQTPARSAWKCHRPSCRRCAQGR